jgi:hypothetical protein
MNRLRAAARLLWNIEKAYSLDIPKQTGSRNEKKLTPGIIEHSPVRVISF